MSKFVFSAFLVGVGSSVFFTATIHERLYERKIMFQPKQNADELVEAFYQQKLREKIQEQQLKLRKSQLQELREKFNSEVVPVIVDSSNKLFSKSPQEIIDEMAKFFQK